MLLAPAMRVIPMTTTLVDASAMTKPLPSEIDVFGITDAGRVRKTNADHFIVASFHRAMMLHASSLGGDDLPTLSRDSRGYLMLVADGVGGLKHAKDGSAPASIHASNFGTSSPATPVSRMFNPWNFTPSFV